MFSAIESTKQPREPVRINCPRCGARGVWADVHEEVQQYKALGIIPLIKTAHTFVRCHNCAGSLVALLRRADMGDRTCEELVPFILPRVRVVHVFTAFTSMALCWFPLIGIVPVTLALIVNRRLWRWPRTVSYVGLAACVVLHVYIGVLVLAIYIKEHGLPPLFSK